LPSKTAAGRFEKYAARARAGGADFARVIPARQVVIAEWVRLKCQYGCGGFNKRLCCPPHAPSPETTRRMLGEYRHALVYSYPGRESARHRAKMMRLLAGIERAAFLDGHYRAFAMGAGPCRLCRTCNVGGLCRFPYLARPAMEACGIDVYATARHAGIPLEVVTRADGPVRYVSLVLLD